MHTHLYFAVVSLAVTRSLPPEEIRLAMQGELREVERRLEQKMETAPRGEVRYADWQAYADIQLLYGRHEEAEQCYREALKLIYHDRRRLRIASCRNIAWQSLFLQRTGPALACFRRVVHDPEAGVTLRFEALVGKTLVLFQSCQLNAALECLSRLAKMALEHSEPLWSDLVSVLRSDIALRIRLRSEDALAAHIFWRSVINEFKPTGIFAPPRQLAARDDNRLLAGHNAFLGGLYRIAQGSANECELIGRYIKRNADIGFNDIACTLKLEVAIAALCGEIHCISETMLKSMGRVEFHTGQATHWQLEFLFCSAMVLQRQGRWRDYETAYRRYALMSVKRARADTAIANGANAGQSPAKTLKPGDDVSSRLTGKYRRAYVYLVDNLNRADLSVNDVAAQIDVSVRALQLTFRKCLGVSPKQLIHRLRMEGIYQDLLTAGATTNVVVVAGRWGVLHRSALSKRYRRMFNESPSETRRRSNN